MFVRSFRCFGGARGDHIYATGCSYKLTLALKCTCAVLSTVLQGATPLADCMENKLPAHFPDDVMVSGAFPGSRTGFRAGDR